MPLINCKIDLELNWIEDSILSSDGNSTKLKITDDKLHAPIVILSTKECKSGKTIKQSVYCNNNQTIPVKVIEKGKNIHELLGAKVLKDYLFLPMLLLQMLQTMKQV